MLHEYRSLQHPWEGVKCSQPVSADGEGGGLGGAWTGSGLCCLPSVGGCHTAASSPRCCLVCSRPGAAPAKQKVLQENMVMKGRVSKSCPESSLREKQGPLGTQDLSPCHWGSQITGMLSLSGMPNTAVNESRKENIRVLCSPYSTVLHICTLDHPLASTFPSVLCIWHILSCLHAQTHKPFVDGQGVRDTS